MKKHTTGKTDEQSEVKGRQEIERIGPTKEAAAPAKAPSKLTSQTEPFVRRNLQAQGQGRLQTALESGRLQSLESHHAHLMRFNVATQRLLDARSREDLFEIIHEIVATLIGCDEFGVFRVDEQCTLSLVAVVVLLRSSVFCHTVTIGANA